MAKGNKHSPALFEVVHGKRHFDKIARDSALRTPSWWFKGRKRMAESGALAPAVTSTAVEDAPPFTDSDAPPSLADPTQNPSILVNRELPRDDSDGAGSVDTMAIPEALTATSGSRRSAPLQFIVDRDRHELFVRVHYTTAAVAGVSIVMLVALAYLTGRHTGRFPSSAIASASSEQIAAGPVEKGVLDLNPRAGNAASATTGPAFMNTGAGGGVTRAPSPRTATQPSATQPGRPGASPSQPTIPPNPEANGKRIVGRQYVLVQSYPPEQKKVAEDARDKLVQAGVNCTVEKAPKGWPPTWFSVIGTTGFDRASGASYENYLAEVEKVNEKFAGKGSFKRFDPRGIRWQERAD